MNVTPALANVAKGSAIQLVVEATGLNNPSSKVVWTHDGTDTYISSTGLMLVGKAEATPIITVTATSTVDALITDTASITVV